MATALNKYGKEAIVITSATSAMRKLLLCSIAACEGAAKMVGAPLQISRLSFLCNNFRHATEHFQRHSLGARGRLLARGEARQHHPRLRNHGYCGRRRDCRRR